VIDSFLRDGPNASLWLPGRWIQVVSVVQLSETSDGRELPDGNGGTGPGGAPALTRAPGQGPGIPGAPWPVSLPVALTIAQASALFVLLSIDYGSLSWRANSIEAILARLLAAALISAVVIVLLRYSRGSRWVLAAAVFAVVYGTMYLLPATETTYVASVVPLSRAVGMVANGLVIAGVFSVTAVTFFGPRPSEGEHPNPSRLRMPWREWRTKLLELAVVWTLLFILFGTLVYGPIARALDPSGYSSEQASVTNAGLALLSQPLWAIASVALTVPWIRALTLDARDTALGVGVLYGVLIGADMLLATGMSAGLQIGHLAESVGESLAFGVLAVWILQLHGRLSVPIGGTSGTGVLGLRQPVIAR